jgi:hypothetical protein
LSASPLTKRSRNPRWITIPPPAVVGFTPLLDHFVAARWVTPWAPPTIRNPLELLQRHHYRYDPRRHRLAPDVPEQVCEGLVGKRRWQFSWRSR